MNRSAYSLRACGRRRRPNPMLLPLSMLMLVTVAACSKKPDTTPPDPVTGLTAVAGNGRVTLTWEASTAGDLSHYVVQRGTSEATLTDLVSNLFTPTHQDNTVAPGTTYFYAVVAVDDAGNRSDPSLAVSIKATSQDWETGQGWAAFALHDYDEAVSRFSAAIGFAAGYAPGFLGLGWSLAFQGQLTEARNALNSAVASSLAGQDANAGLAVVLRDLPDLTGCVARGEMVLGVQPPWEFSRRPAINARAIRVIVTQAYFRLGSATYPNAQAHLDVLDPANGLDPADHASWVVDGITYPSYAEALLKAIERLNNGG